MQGVRILMGNRHPQANTLNSRKPDSVDNAQAVSYQVNEFSNLSYCLLRHSVMCIFNNGLVFQRDASLNSNLSGRSFASVSSCQSTYSVSRPWSRFSRRR